MEKLKKFFINGTWVNPRSDETMAVISPSDLRQIGTVSLGNEQDVNDAVQSAKKAFTSFSKTKKKERIDLLKDLKRITERRFEDLAQAMREEMGAPISMARSAQADAAVGHLESFIGALAELKERTVLDSGDILLKEPVGICGLITPWNWPVNQIALKVIPALATGCTCILKPSEYTPLSAMVYTEIIEEAGYPAGVFNLVNGVGDTVGRAMSKHLEIDMMSFTGSTRAGIMVTKDSSETIKRVTLELGGKSPNIVFSDANLERDIKYSINECMFNTGQSCDAPTRLLVEHSCYEEVLKIAKKSAEEILIGDPTKEGDHIGPLFDQIQFDRVQNMIDLGIKEGASVLTGGLGKPHGLEKGWFVKPTIFYNVRNTMRIAREEIFGPVLVIMPFKNEQEAISIANDSPYGLAAYVQTSDIKKAERVSSQLRVGAVHINGGGYNYGTPFGGYKQSGNGREGGLMGLEDYLETKSLHGL